VTADTDAADTADAVGPRAAGGDADGPPVVGATATGRPGSGRADSEQRAWAWAGDGRRWRLSVLGLAVVELAVGVFLAVRTRHEWFFVDEWDFLARRVGRDAPVGLLVPHNEHPSMLPILVWRAVFDVFGIRHYAPYMAVVIACHLAVVATVWLVARRSGAGPGACLVAAAVMATAGVGWEDMIWAFQIGMVGSLLASWAGALLTDHPPGTPRAGRRRLVATWVVLSAGLACSAVSVPLLVLPLLVAGARRGIRAALVVVAVPAVLFCSWYAVWGRDGVSASRGFVPLAMPGYVVHGLSTALDGLTGIVGTAAVVLVLVVLGLRSGVLGARRARTATAGLVGVLALYLFIAIGRASLGDAQAQASRYAYLSAALVLPAAAVGLQRLVGAARAGTPASSTAAGRTAARTAGTTASSTAVWVAVGVVTVGICGQGLGVLDGNIQSRLAAGRVTLGQAAAAEALVRSGSPLLEGVAPDRYSSNLDGAGVLRLHRLGALRTLPRPRPAALAAARLTFQVQLAPRTTRPVFDRSTAPLLPLSVGVFRAAGTSLRPVPTGVAPRAWAVTPRVLVGRLAPVPPGFPASSTCVSTAPVEGSLVVSLALADGARAALLLVEGTAPVQLSWVAGRTPLASRTVVVPRDTVEQLTTLSGAGELRVTAQHTLTLCRVR